MDAVQDFRTKWDRVQAFFAGHPPSAVEQAGERDRGRASFAAPVSKN